MELDCGGALYIYNYTYSDIKKEWQKNFFCQHSTACHITIVSKDQAKWSGSGKVIYMLIGICDDNPAFCNVLQDILHRGNYVTERDTVMEFHGAKELLDSESPFKFDILFLDIQMPELSGVDLLRRYRSLFQDSRIVYTTAYTDYAAECYEYNAYRYLLKPIQENKLTELFRAVRKELVLEKTLRIRCESIEVVFQVGDIIYAEGYNKLTRIKTREETWISYIRLKDLKAMLPEKYFYQTHKSCIINMNAIKEIDRNNRWIIASDGSIVDISVRNKKDFLETYVQFLLKYK